MTRYFFIFFFYFLHFSFRSFYGKIELKFENQRRKILCPHKWAGILLRKTKGELHEYL